MIRCQCVHAHAYDVVIAGCATSHTNALQEASPLIRTQLSTPRLFVLLHFSYICSSSGTATLSSMPPFKLILMQMVPNSFLF